MHALLQDVKFGLRLLKQNSLFTAIAVLTLGLGIGANSAIFSLTNAVLMRNFSFPDSERIVAISGESPHLPPPILVSFTKFTEVKQQSQTLDRVAAYYVFNMSLATRGEAEPITAARVSPDFFSTLGISPAIGRTFSADQHQPGGADVVVVSDNFWHSHYGGDPDLVGKAITLDGKSLTVIGILPATFQFPVAFPEPQLWLPRIFETSTIKPEMVHSGAGYLFILARMKANETFPQLQAELRTIDARYKQQFPNYADATQLSLTAAPLKEFVVGNLRSSFEVLLGVVGFVLLIACANVASMLLVKVVARQKEIAIRKALGATRVQLIRQFLTESLVLSLAGGVLGIVLASLLLRLSRSIAPGTIPRLEEASLNLPVLFFCLALCVAAALVFGLVPALQASGLNLHDALKEGSRGAAENAVRQRARAILVVGEVAIALVLLTGAGLLAKSFLRTLSVDPGFESRNVMTFPITLPTSRYSEPEQQTEFFRELVERVQNLPGVQQAAVTSFLPLSGAFRMVFFCPEGQVCRGLGKDPIIACRQVTPAYFRTMQTPLLRGRTFTDADTATGEPVVIVNQATVDHYWPGQDPIGKHLANSRDQIRRLVIGVAGNVRYNTLTAPVTDEMYLPFAQSPSIGAVLVVRSPSDPQSLVTSVRGEVGKIDSNFAIADVESLEQVVSTSVAQPRLTMQFVTAFSGLALLLSAIGIYAVISYMVSRRRQELGIRMALGAQRRNILRIVLGQGMGLTVIGVGCGIVVSLALTRLLSGLLFEIRATDPLALGGAVACVLITAFLACYLPARKASKMDPMTVLR